MPIHTPDPQHKLPESIQTGDFESAQLAVSGYGASVRSAMQAAAEQQSRQAIFKSAICTLEHALLVARAARSHIAFRLATVQRELAYQGDVRNQNGWFIDC